MNENVILNLGGGGGTPLNFKVIGNPQPTNPKVNTIWLNTDVPINGYDFNATEPANQVQGMVWITIGDSSPVAFNALKKNGIMVYPISAKQYISGAWVDKTAKSYQNGEWVDWWTGEMYKSGNEYKAVTGGWVGKGLRWGRASSIATPPVITKNSDRMSVTLINQSSNGNGGVATTANEMDLTLYKTLTVRMSGNKRPYNKMGIIVYDNNLTSIGDDFSNAVAYHQFQNDSVPLSNYTVDISNVTGAFAVGLYMYCANGETLTAEIYDVGVS